MLKDQGLESRFHGREEDGPFGVDVVLFTGVGGGEVELVPRAYFAQVQRCERRALACQSAEEVLHGAGRVKVLAVVPKAGEVVPGLARLAVRWDGHGDRRRSLDLMDPPRDPVHGNPIENVFEGIRVVEVSVVVNQYEVKDFIGITLLLIHLVIYLVVYLIVPVIRVKILVNVSGAGYYPTLLKIVQV